MQGSVGFPVLHAQREARDIARGGVGRGGGGGIAFVTSGWKGIKKKNTYYCSQRTIQKQKKAGRSSRARGVGITPDSARKVRLYDTMGTQIPRYKSIRGVKAGKSACPAILKPNIVN